MSAARTPSGRGPGRGSRPGGGGLRPKPPAAATPRRLEAPAMSLPVARWHLVGLGLFAGGFAAAGVIVATGAGSSGAYYAAVLVGIVGGVVLARQGGRTATDVHTPPIWSPRGLARVADGAGVPALPVQVVFYALIAVSVVGNVVVPLLPR